MYLPTLPPLHSSTTMGKELTLMVAQAMPARANMTFISRVGLSARRKLATPKATVSMMTPA